MADRKLIEEVGKYIDRYYEPARDDIKIDKEMLSVLRRLPDCGRNGQKKEISRRILFVKAAK